MSRFNGDNDELKSLLTSACTHVSPTLKFKEKALNRLLQEQANLKQKRAVIRPRFAISSAIAAVLVIVAMLVLNHISTNQQKPISQITMPTVTTSQITTSSSPQISTSVTGTSPTTSLPSSQTTSSPQVSTTTSSPYIAHAGFLEILVTDAPPEKTVTAIVVTVDSIEVHMPGAADDDTNSWITTTLSSNNTFDLLQLQGREELLARATLDAGKYTQMRMEIPSVVVSFSDGTTQDATLPSGTLRLVQPFEIIEGETTVLLFDFDAAQSLTFAGENALFKPVIKITATSSENLTIATSTLPDGRVDTIYQTATLTATGGTTPYTWSLAEDTSLPPGLSLSNNGIISGTPTEKGNFKFTVQVTDAAAETTTRDFTIHIIK